MIVLLDKDNSDSNNDSIILKAEINMFKTGILAVNGFIAKREIEDLIEDTRSAVYFVSSQLYVTITNRGQL